MTRITSVFALVLATVVISFAQTNPAAFLQVSRFTVRSAAAPQFEDSLKKVNMARVRAGGTSVFMSPAGSGVEFIYVVVTPFSKGSEIDSFPAIPAALIERQETEVFRTLTRLSTKPRLSDPHPMYITITRTEVKPQAIADYEVYLSKVKAAEEAQPDAVTTMRQVCTRRPGGIYEAIRFYITQSERDGSPSQESILRRVYGDEEARQMIERAKNYVVKWEYLTLNFRPDLSTHRTPATRSN